MVMSMHMVCNSDEGGLEMTTEGAYTESSYSMNSTIVISAGVRTTLPQPPWPAPG